MKRGFIPAAFSPFHRDYSLNIDAIPTLAELYRVQGCSTVFINGTTGEFASLTLKERMLLAETWIRKSTGMSVWVHVGTPCQSNAIQMAQHAQEIGAEAISALAPYYFTPSTETQLIDFLEPIARAAHDLPFYYYHIPSMTHVMPDIASFIHLAIERIPNFTGLKFSSPDLYSLQKAKMAADQKGKSLECLFGVDEMLLGALPFGIHGAIGSTYNFATPLYQAVVTHFQDHQLDQAQVLQSKSAAIVNEFHAYGGIATGKAIMEMLGVSCGPPRPPLSSLVPEERQNLYKEISDMDIFPYALLSPENQ